MEEVLQAQLDSLWDKVKPVANREDKSPTMWHYQITPAFPSAWPPSKDLALIYYVFAYGFNPNLFDGNYVAAPWAQLVLQRGGDDPPALITLTAKLKPIGTQGVRPMRPEEVTVYQHENAVKTYIGELTALPDKGDPISITFREYYCQWLRLNGVIGRHLRDQHELFIAWLDC